MKSDYIAGLVDGEGSMFISENGVSETYQPELSIANTSKELLDNVAEWFGIGGVCKTGKKSRVEAGGRQCYAFRIRGRALLDALPRFMDSLELKKPQAVAVLEAASLLSEGNSHYSSGTRERLAYLRGYVQWLNADCP